MNFTREFAQKVAESWKDKDYVLKLALQELKDQTTYPGLGGETCTRMRRDESTELAGKIGLVLGSALSAAEFLHGLQKHVPVLPGMDRPSMSFLIVPRPRRRHGRRRPQSRR